MTDNRQASWPELPLASWRDTCATLQLWTQIIGKIRLTLSPWLNHSWHVTLYVTARGLSTSPIPYGTRNFDMEFDFVGHNLMIRLSDGREAAAPEPAAQVFELTVERRTEMDLERSKRRRR